MICMNNPTISQIPPRHFTNTKIKKIFRKKFSKTGRLLCMQYKTSRKEALAAGDIRYLGGPCKYGHKGLRYTRKPYFVQNATENTQNNTNEKPPKDDESYKKHTGRDTQKK
jgi:hypothetical protein